jgi:2-polyprenyl-3-methyl-5-hydroxy-6-metoxy-1,4-benzoquinol methylase
MIESGIVKIDTYKKVLAGEEFRTLENYSMNFTIIHDKLFPEFSKRWVKDSFHQWSRQYEYPFAAEAIRQFLPENGRILDAGSGITFFPYYLKEKHPGAEIECCDYDEKLEIQFDRVNKEKNAGVKYFTADIKNIKKPDRYYDLIYCISVLEHTDDYEAVVKEFSRITSDGGHLVLSFDVSLDGSADIPPGKAEELLRIIDKYYVQVPDSIAIDGNELSGKHILTTNFIKGFNKKLLPWKFPYLMFFKSLSKGQVPKYLIRNLACYCGIFKKK